MKVVELFSGIGSQAKALSRISKKRNISIEISQTCEWDIHALIAYDIIHNNGRVLSKVESMSKEELVEKLSKYTLSYNGKDKMTFKQLKSLHLEVLKRAYSSILKNHNLVDVNDVTASDIDEDTTLLTYSFPCQDLSNVGSFHGYKHGIDRDKNTRSGLLWEVERILVEKKNKNHKLPKYLLLENVTSLEAKRHKGNFNQWKEKLTELGYINKVYKLNALDFGIPQNRKRLIMLSVFVGNDVEMAGIINKYWSENDLNNPSYIKSLNLRLHKLNKLIKTNYSNELYLKEALECQPNDTTSRRKIWENNNKILSENLVFNNKVQTITTRQDRHPNAGVIYFNPNNEKSKFRFLTPRECFILMGFNEEDFNRILSKNFYSRKHNMFYTRDKLYKLAGNSIVVNVLENVFDQLIDIDNLIS